jgi:putative molybdopterin biosynthesis protein
MKQVFGIKEACEFLKIGKPTLYKHVRSGDIPAFKIGRVLRFDKESLEKWIEQKVSTETQAKKDKI